MIHCDCHHHCEVPKLRASLMMADHNDARAEGSSSSGRAGPSQSNQQDTLRGMSWSIHAASDNDDWSDTSDSEDDIVERTRRRRLRRLNAQARGQRPAQPSRQPSTREDEQDYQLRLAHAMTHNPVDALLPSPPRSRSQSYNAQAGASGMYRSARVITVNDIKNRSCWICSDGDVDDESAAGKGAPARRWVHPCKCSLIAHESCLLQWIRSRRATVRDPNKVILCPQCSCPYRIIEQKPVMLRLFERSDLLLRKTLPIASAGVVGGTILVAASAYGCVAIRLWMGKDAAIRLLNRKWPWHYFLEIPFVPFALILSRLPFFDRATVWLPAIVTFPVPILHVPLAAAVIAASPDPRLARRNWNVQRRTQISPLFSMRMWPPGPLVTLIFMPWVRSLYLLLKRSITRKILATFVKTGTGGGTLTAAADTADRDQAEVRQSQRDERRHGIIRIIVGQDVPHEGGAADGETVGIDEDGNARDIPAGAEAIDSDHNVYVSPTSLAKMCLGALSAPLVAHVMGNSLARLATNNYWLRRFLGIEEPSGRRFDIEAASASRMRSAAQPTRSPIANLFFGGSTTEVPADRLAYPEYDSYASGYVGVGAMDGRDGGPIRYDDLDPAWFRNTIGVGLFIVVKDAIQLGFRYLRLQHARDLARRTRIVDRPFAGSMIDGLDLREPL